MRRVMAAVFKVLVFEAVIAAVLFGSAGRVDLPWFWVLIAVHTVVMFVNVGGIDPDLGRERLRPAPGGPAGKEYFFRLGGTALILLHLAIAGLDAGRFHWSDPPPVIVRVMALVLYVAAMGFGLWAMLTNRFFSSVVRLQSDRGHHVIDTGPYRFVRHPGYAGMMVAALTGGIVLGSWWSVLPMASFAPMVLRRLAMEDRFLHTELEGYRDYAGRVRSKLLPGLW